MSPLNVVVIFHSISGSTEKLALAAAVGAVQARANIRLRRLSDSGEESAECVRMRKEYVPPKDADLLWADAVIIAVNGKICGVTLDASGATAYGRKIAADTRALKEAPDTIHTALRHQPPTSR
jgi:hypothetical protein